MGLFGGIAGMFTGGDSHEDAQIGAGAMLPGASPQQQQETYNQAQAGLGQQQDFVNALQAQNGVGNQSAALAGMQGLQGQMQGANGVGNQSSVFNQQQALANQLGGLAAGTGPNPAQAALNQATGQNVANQASLMAGQRGASSNVGLMARQAAQQGAATQQQAVGQGATMQAQQQIAAMNALQGQQANMGNLANTQVSQLQGQQGMAGNMATQQVGQQQGALNAYNQASQSLHGQAAGNIQQQNATTAGMQSNLNNIYGGENAGDRAGQQDMFRGAVKSLPSVGSVMGGGKAHGGLITKNYAEGGAVSGPQSIAGQYLFGSAAPAPITSPNIEAYNPGNVGAPLSSFASDTVGAGKGGFGAPEPKKEGGGMPSVPGLDSITSGAPTPMAGLQGDAAAGGAGGVGGMIEALGPLALVAAHGGVIGEQLAAQGKLVPGKAKVKGDSLKNDTVPARLSPGEVVIPRSIMSSKDPSAAAAKFVAAVMAKNGLSKKKK